MKRKQTHQNCRAAQQKRRGVAALEAAIITPVLLILVLGTIEMGTALRASTIMQSAVREAGRVAAMDWSHIGTDGDTPNAKLERDLRNFLVASGIAIYENDGAGGSVDKLDFSIVHAEGQYEGQPFDLSDPDNELELATITVKLPYSQISLFPTRYMGGSNVAARLTLRAGAGGGISN
ncbi:MAG: hypothetical protein Fues2KO_32910 [Fuerstiella sp.]